MAQSGATLREVGTTNRTRVADYVASIGPRTAMLLRVHPSNFRIEGFTERPSLTDLVAAARAAGAAARRRSRQRLPDRRPRATSPPCRRRSRPAPTWSASAATSCSAAHSAASSSGAARSSIRLRRHPLMRAMRVDKLTLAALEGTLLEYLAGRAARDGSGRADDAGERGQHREPRRRCSPRSCTTAAGMSC